MTTITPGELSTRRGSSAGLMREIEAKSGILGLELGMGTPSLEIGHYEDCIPRQNTNYLERKEKLQQTEWNIRDPGLEQEK